MVNILAPAQREGEKTCFVCLTVGEHFTLLSFFAMLMLVVLFSVTHVILKHTHTHIIQCCTKVPVKCRLTFPQRIRKLVFYRTWHSQQFTHISASMPPLCSLLFNISVSRCRGSFRAAPWSTSDTEKHCRGFHQASRLKLLIPVSTLHICVMHAWQWIQTNLAGYNQKQETFQAHSELVI